jgi:hypothetical protein
MGCIGGEIVTVAYPTNPDIFEASKRPVITGLKKLIAYPINS